jgi:hypothetical protein
VAVQIQCPAGTPYDPDNPPDDTSTCELVEVGSYLDPAGNNFWGVETSSTRTQTARTSGER